MVPCDMHVALCRPCLTGPRVCVCVCCGLAVQAAESRAAELQRLNEQLAQQLVRLIPLRAHVRCARTHLTWFQTLLAMQRSQPAGMEQPRTPPRPDTQPSMPVATSAVPPPPAATATASRSQHGHVVDASELYSVLGLPSAGPGPRDDGDTASAGAGAGATTGGDGDGDTSGAASFGEAGLSPVARPTRMGEPSFVFHDEHATPQQGGGATSTSMALATAPTPPAFTVSFDQVRANAVCVCGVCHLPTDR